LIGPSGKEPRLPRKGAIRLHREITAEWRVTLRDWRGCHEESESRQNALLEVRLKEIHLRLAGLVKQRTRVMQESKMSAVDLPKLLGRRG
jgi:hypothetical protein